MVRGIRVGFRGKVVLALMALSAGIFVSVAGSSSADVTGVVGSAYGYSAPDTVLFGGAQAPIGPVPTVTLPAAGSALPITAHADTGRVAYGPGVLFTSGPIDVSTEGSTGAGGSVTSTAHIENNPTSTAGEIVYAGTIDSTCIADENGVTTDVALSGPGDAGHSAPTLRISDGNPDIDGDETYVDLPVNPAPNLTISGNLEGVGDHFTVVFNEQILNADGSTTVNAVHEYLLGPTLTGNLLIGQVTCGVTAGPSTTSTTPTSSTIPTSSTTSTSSTVPTSSTSTSSTTSTTAPPSATLTGNAYGYNAPDIILFGGAQKPFGPTPIVTLPPGGSATPVTANAASGDVHYGPGVLFTSGPIDVSTQGTAGTVTSKAHIQHVPTSTVGEILYSGDIQSTCTATAASASGAASLAGPGDAGHTSATLRTSEGNPDIDGDETYVDIPLNPEPNLTISGNLEGVGDHFTVVFNEQIMNPDGSITVNAVHEKLLGPTLTGNLTLGHVECGVNTAPPPPTTSTTTSTTVVPPTVCDATATGTGTAQASPSSVQQGGDTTVTGSGFSPGESLDLNLCTTPVSLGTITVDSGGGFSAKVTIPSGTAAGAHTIVVSNTARSKVVLVSLTVTSASNGGGGGSGRNGGGTTVTGTTGGGNALARTGAEFARMGWLAGLALLLGIWLVRAARFERYAAPWTRRRWW